VPTDREYDSWIDQNCLPAFRAYTGIDLYSQEILGLGTFVPADDAWRDGMRDVVCYAYRVDGSQMSQSVKVSS
jgi:hypothetical protein